MTNEIEKELVSYLKDITSKYESVSAKYEFSDEENTYIVSYSPCSLFQKDEKLCEYVIEHEKEFRYKYKEETPLFCFDESLYEFSWNAICVEGGNIASNDAFDPNITIRFNWMKDQEKNSTITSNEEYIESCSNYYKFAA